MARAVADAVQRPEELFRQRPDCPDAPLCIAVSSVQAAYTWREDAECPELASLIREIFGNPFRPVVFSPDWCDSTAVALARQMYESRDFSAMPILADALQDGGCDNSDILDHCRGSGPHVRGCWVVDLVLGKGRAQGPNHAWQLTPRTARRGG